jgi:uncharacterized membrane protein
LYGENKSPIIVSKEDLELRWDNLILLVEKAEDEYVEKINKNRWTWFFPLAFLLLLFITLKIFSQNWHNTFFLLFPFIGFLLSITALKDLFGTKSEFFESFCNLTAATDCNAVIGSKKWKIFDIIGFSDLSIILFSSQILSLIIFLFLADTSTYFSIQKAILTFAIPVVILSIYYQKNVEKKWCPICLMISSIIILEFLYVIYFYPVNFSFQHIVVFALVLLVVNWCWFILKKLLITQKELKEYQLTSNRFMRNYEIFKNTLVAKDSYDLPDSPIILGNRECKNEITIITSPFCGHCEKVHNILDNILASNHENLRVKIIMNLSIDNLDQEQKVFVRSLMSSYLEKGDDYFMKALHEWFASKNLKNWIIKYGLTFETDQVDEVYNQHSRWCAINDFNFTPIIFINSYQYPKKYNRENLEFFINELLEDEFLQHA